MTHTSGPVAARPPALRLTGLRKSFGGIHALRGVDLTVEPGEVHGLIGVNGSGKSTLVKVLAGYHAPDGGDMELWGEAVTVTAGGNSASGMAVIHQDLGLVPDLSVAENMMVSVGFGERAGVIRRIDWRAEKRRCQQALDEFGVEVEAAARVGDLTQAARAGVAIVRAIRQLRESGSPNQILVLDEPTVYLPKGESERLCAQVRSFAASGVSVILISHDLREVQATCDRISILRDGVVRDCVSAGELTSHDLVRLMIGQDLDAFFPDPPDADQDTQAVMRVTGMSGMLTQDVSFDIRRGEVLGVTGLAGMGQDELPYLAVGMQDMVSGCVELDGKEWAPEPHSALRRGVVVVPADRSRFAVWRAGRVWENLTLPVLASHTVRGRLSKTKELRAARELIAKFGVQPADPHLPLSALSGGNQQKVVMAKALQVDPKVLLLHEPTQGVDAGGARDILEIIRAAASGGAAVAMFSSDYEQLAHMCDRVLVLVSGRIVRELSREGLSEERIAHACHAA